MICEFVEVQSHAPFVTVDPSRLETAWIAAESWVTARVRYPAPLGIPSEIPDALKQAVLLMTARYLGRENSPDGFIGMGDTVAYLPKIDRDVESLIAPWRPVVFG